MNSQRRSACEGAYMSDPGRGGSGVGELLDDLERILDVQSHNALTAVRGKAEHYDELWDAFVELEGELEAVKSELDEAQAAQAAS